MYAVIMAGGSGTRFWPLSRKHRPKQLLPIGTEEALIVETVKRLSPLLSPEQIMVVAGPQHAEPIAALLPNLGSLIIEPCARNTAAAIGLAAIHLRHRDPQAVMAVLPADHHIEDGARFRTLLSSAAEQAQAGEIITLGIKPNRPETGYGYIQYQPSGSGESIYEVKRFVEKPPESLAKRYLSEGDYLWNSGMFVFSAQRILEDLTRFLPELAAGLEEIAGAIDTSWYEQVLDEIFASFASISIDYGVMEQAERVQVIPAEMGWNDVGHWAAMADFAQADQQGNILRGPGLLLDSQGCIAHSEDGRLLALLGLEEMVVVSTDDVVMVCPKARAQDVRDLVQKLKERGEERLL